jgi:hypothetical protein
MSGCAPDGPDRWLADLSGAGFVLVAGAGERSPADGLSRGLAR